MAGLVDRQVPAWLYNSTRCSVLLAVLLHASGNLGAGYLAVTPVYPQLVLTGLGVPVAVALVYGWGSENSAKRARVDRDDVHEHARVTRR